MHCYPQHDVHSESSLFQMSRVLRFFSGEGARQGAALRCPEGHDPNFRGRECHLTSTTVGGLVIGDYVGDSDGLVAFSELKKACV